MHVLIKRGMNLLISTLTAMLIFFANVLFCLFVVFYLGKLYKNLIIKFRLLHFA